MLELYNYFRTCHETISKFRQSIIVDYQNFFLYFISNSMPRVIKRILLNLFKVYPFTVFSFYCFYLKTLAFKIVSFI